MTFLKDDWDYLKNSAEVLENYLLSSQWMWPDPSGLNDNQRQVQLMPGNVLLSISRLEAYSWLPADYTRLKDLTATSDGIIDHWKHAWDHKMKTESNMRIRLWNEYISELIKDPKIGGKNYGFQVRTRVIIQLFFQLYTGEDPSEQARIAQMDMSLRSITRDGPFIWESEIQQGFPFNPYWYLYVKF